MLHVDNKITLVSIKNKLSAWDDQPAALDAASLRLGCLTVGNHDVAIETMLVFVSMRVNAVKISSAAAGSVSLRRLTGSPLSFTAFVDASVEVKSSELSPLGQAPKFSKRQLKRIIIYRARLVNVHGNRAGVSTLDARS